MKRNKNNNDIISTLLLSVQSDTINDYVWDWKFSSYSHDALLRTRSHAIDNVGGIDEYLDQHHFSDYEIKALKGFVAEEYRNSNEHSSSFSATPNDEQIDRYVDGHMVQDYAGKSLYQFGDKLVTDANAERFQITDELYQKIQDYLTDNPESHLGKTLNENLWKIQPDSDLGGKTTDTDFYDQHTREGVNILQHPIESLFDQVTHVGGVAAGIFIVNGLIIEAISKGGFNIDMVEQVLVQMPNNMMKYAAFSGASYGFQYGIGVFAHEMQYAAMEKFIENNTALVLPGIGLVISSSLKIFKYLRGELPGYKLHSQLYRGTLVFGISVGTKLFLTSQLYAAVMKGVGVAVVDISGGLLTVITIAASVLSTIAIYSHDAHQKRKYEHERIIVTIAYYSSKCDEQLGLTRI